MKRNHQIATIGKLKKEFTFHLEVLPIVKDDGESGGWRGVFLARKQGNPNGKYLPGIFTRYKRVLCVYYSYDGTYKGECTTPLVWNTWINIDFKQEKQKTGNAYVITVTVNGKVLKTIVNNQAEEFENVTVHTSDGGYPALVGDIRMVYYDKGI